MAPKGSSAALRIRDIGAELYARGGMEAMREAHAVVAKNMPPGGARGLEIAWDGIGDWQG